MTDNVTIKSDAEIQWIISRLNFQRNVTECLGALLLTFSVSGILMTNSPLSIYYVKIRAVLLPILLLLLLGTISLWKVLGEKLEGYQKADFRRTSSLAIAASPYASVTLELKNVLKYRNYLTVIECEHFERTIKKLTKQRIHG